MTLRILVLKLLAAARGITVEFCGFKRVKHEATDFLSTVVCSARRTLVVFGSPLLDTRLAV